MWQEFQSKTHQRPYWVNQTTGERTWSKPNVDGQENSLLGSKRNRDDSEIPIVKSSSSATTSGEIYKEAKRELPKIAIIVPFRDLHVEQNRAKHLHAFLPAITQFLDTTQQPYSVFIVQQSDDNRKFNRGKLLNIGFDLALQEDCEIFIFHDVDLIPSPELATAYCTAPTEHSPVHIARVWDRYSSNKKYFGGVVSFTQTQFTAVNGFPNNFWGWGGEDDEIYKRVVDCNFTIASPDSGHFIDLEEMSLDSKLKVLREHKVWKCMNKNEILNEHDSTWRSNGLSQLRYKVLSNTTITLPSSSSTTTTQQRQQQQQQEAVKNTQLVTVDVLLNDHWSDLACGVNDSQLTKSVEELKQLFQKQQLIKLKEQQQQAVKS